MCILFILFLKASTVKLSAVTQPRCLWCGSTGVINYLWLQEQWGIYVNVPSQCQLLWMICSVLETGLDTSLLIRLNKGLALETSSASTDCHNLHLNLVVMLLPPLPPHSLHLNYLLLLSYIVPYYSLYHSQTTCKIMILSTSTRQYSKKFVMLPPLLIFVI